MAKKKRKKLSGLAGRTVFALVGLFILLTILWSVSPLAARLKQGRELASLEKQYSDAENENRDLRNEIKKLRGDQGYIEKLARTNLGMIKSDEEAYVLIEQPEVVKEPKEPAPDPGLWESFKQTISGFTGG